MRGSRARLGHHLLRLCHVRLEHACAASFAATAAHERGQPAHPNAENPAVCDGRMGRKLGCARDGAQWGGWETEVRGAPVAIIEEIDGGRTGGFEVL